LHPVAILTADTHLRDRAWIARRNLAGDAYYSFRQITRLAIQWQTPVIAAGDLIDQRLNASDVPAFLREVFDEMAAAEVPFYYIQGQHELADPPWLRAVHGWPIWLGEPGSLYEVAGLRVLGFDWRHADQVDEIYQACQREKPDLLVIHQVCRELLGPNLPHEFVLASIRGTGLVLVGDYHVHKRLKIRGPSGEVRVLSPGSTAMQSIDEDPNKYVFVLYEDSSIRSHQLCTRPVLRWQRFVDTEDALEELLEALPGEIEAMRALAEEWQLPEEVRTPVVIVRHDASLDGATKKIRSACGDVHLMLRTIWPKAEKGIPDVSTDSAGSLTLESCLPLALSPQEDKEAFELADRLLRAKNAREALDEARGRYVAEASVDG